MRNLTLNKILSSRVFYIVFSLLVSIALWMYVEINENVIGQFEIANIPVVKLNEELLSDRNLLISSTNPNLVSLTFDCPRSVATRLNNGPLSVVIDVGGITSTGYTFLRYEIDYPPGIDIKSIENISKSAEGILLYIDRISTVPIPVEVWYKGGVAEGYLQDPTVFSPQTIMISGPAEVVSMVKTARVEVARENLASTYYDELPFILLDENGEELDETIRDQLSFSEELINVTIPVRVIKEIALTVTFSFVAGATEQNTNYTVDPPVIVVAGDPDDLRDFNSINLATIDLSRFEYSDTLPPYQIVLPNNVTNISGETEALVYVEVLGLSMRYLSVSNIFYISEPAGYLVEIRTQSVDVRIRGRQEDLENVTVENIRVVADLTDVGPGPQRVPARVYIDGIDADIGAIGNYWVTLSVYREP